MGIRWTDGGPSALSAKIGAKGMGGINALMELMKFVAVDGAEEMAVNIGTTPSALVPGKPDRIWTGDMLEDVGYKPLQQKGHTVTATFGWVGDVQDYYLKQEYGKGHVPTPMFALTNSFIKQREELFSVIREWTKR